MLEDKNTKREPKIQQSLKVTYNDMTIKTNDNLYEIGIDEVGRGPLFGRVYCSAVILPKDGNFNYKLMKDSKKFHSKKKIQEVAQYIKDNAIAWSIGYEDEKSIDSNNIRQATFMAMHNAIKNITESHNKDLLNKYYLLVDGNDFKPYVYINQESCMIEQIPHVNIEGGDNKYCAIAAASILAKVERDTYILELCTQYPKLSDFYELEKNMGYGTKTHMDGIVQYNISPWHRKSYGPCKETMVNDAEFYKI
jgi:ribonuclease HII